MSKESKNYNYGNGFNKKKILHPLHGILNWALNLIDFFVWFSLLFLNSSQVNLLMSTKTTSEQWFLEILGTPYQGRNNYCGSYLGNIQNAKNNVSAFTQRIMSAKLLRVKQLQNQLAESQSVVNVSNKFR